MLVEGLMDVVYVLLSLLTAPISIPGMPDEVKVFVAEALEYISFGISLLANWTDLGYLLTLFGLVLTVDVGLLLYRLVMWFVRKIPMLGIE